MFDQHVPELTDRSRASCRHSGRRPFERRCNRWIVDLGRADAVAFGFVRCSVSSVSWSALSSMPLRPLSAAEIGTVSATPRTVTRSSRSESWPDWSFKEPAFRDSLVRRSQMLASQVLSMPSLRDAAP